jgi:hypothetical protein
MSKVYENTARRIVAFSDDGYYKLIAQRRAIQTERHGHTAYAGSYWTLDTYRREGISFVPYSFAGLPGRFGKKQEIIDALAKSVRFTQAYKELAA